MQTDPNGVDCAIWLRCRPGDVRKPHRVIAPLSGGYYCQLCEHEFTDSTDAHHAEHMPELDAYQAGRREAPGPTVDSVRRAAERRERRQRTIDRTVLLGEDPYLHLVVGVDPATQHRRRQRRLRHPREETYARVRALHERQVLPAAIADQLHLGDKYVQRLIRQLEIESAA